MQNTEGRVYSGVFWAFGERFLAQVVSAVVSVVLAQFIDPEHFGLIAMVTVIVAIFNAFVSGGLGNALIQKKDADQVDFSSVLLFSFLMAIGIYILLFFAAIPIASFYKMPGLIPVIRIMGIRLPIASINSVQHAIVSKQMRFRMFFFATLIGTVFSAVTGIVMAVRGFGVYSLVAQYLLNVTIDTIVLGLLLRERIGFAFSWQRLKTILPFGLSIMLSEVASTISDSVRTFIVGKKYTSDQLAYYSKGNQFPSLVVSNINTALSRVLFPALSIEQDEAQRVEMLTTRTLQTSFYCLTPLLLGLSFCARDIVLLIYNEKWRGLISYIQILSLSYLFMPIHTTSLQRLKAEGKGRIYLRTQVVKVSIGLSLVIVALTCFDGAIYVAFATLTAHMINTCIHVIINARVFKQSLGKQFGLIARIVLANCVMCAALFAVDHLGIRPLFGVILKVIVGAGIYYAVSQILKIDVFFKIRAAVMKKLRKRKR